jgi:hypothetical protein
MKRILFGLLLLAACSTPGREVVPQPTDFAFIEVLLKG